MFISYRFHNVKNTGKYTSHIRYELIHTTFKSTGIVGTAEYFWDPILKEYMNRKFSSKYIGESLARWAIINRDNCDDFNYSILLQNDRVEALFHRSKEIILERDKTLSKLLLMT